MSPNMRCRFGAWSPAYCGVTTWRQRPGGKPSSIFGRNGIGITRLHCQCVMQVPARRMEPAGRGARRVLKSSPRQVGVGVKRVLDLGVSVVVPAPDANAPPVFGGQPYFSISFGRDSGPCGRTWCIRRGARRACLRCRRCEAMPTPRAIAQRRAAPPIRSKSEFSAHTGQNRTRRLAGANCKS